MLRVHYAGSGMSGRIGMRIDSPTIPPEQFTPCPTCAAHFAAVDGAWKEGVTLYAWWRDGVQYVGTCGRTLKEALTEGGIR